MSKRKKILAFKRWQVLMSTTIIQSIVVGVIECYGGMMIPIMKVFEKAEETNFVVKASFIGSLSSGCLLGFSPMSGYMVNKIGVANVGVLGGIIVFLASFLASFTHSFILLALTYALMLGMGSSFLFIANNVIISQKFADNNIGAFAMLGFGNGVMNSILPHIMVYMVKSIGLHGTIRTICLILSPIMFLPFFWADYGSKDPHVTKPVGQTAKDDNMVTVANYNQQILMGEFALNKLVLRSSSDRDSSSISENVAIDKGIMNFDNHGAYQSDDVLTTEEMNNSDVFFHNFIADELWDFDMVIAGNGDFNESNARTRKSPFTTSFSRPETDKQEELVSEAETKDDSENSFDFLFDKKDHRKRENAGLKIYKDLYETRGFLHLCISMFVAYLGYQVTNIHISNYSQSINLQGNAQMLLTCLGGASAIGALLNPLLLYRFEGSISNFRIFQVYVLCYGIFVMLLPLNQNYAMLMVVCSIIGYCDGSFTTLIGPIVIDFVGNDMAPVAISVFYGISAIAVVASGPLAGFIFEQRRAYDLVFFVSGVFFLIGGMFLSFIQPNIGPPSSQSSAKSVSKVSSKASQKQVGTSAKNLIDKSSKAS